MSAGAAGDVLGYPELPDEFHGASHRSTLLHSRVSARTGTGGATMSGRRCHRSVIYIYIRITMHVCMLIGMNIFAYVYIYAYMHMHICITT